jgi:hypothetical protein
VRLVLDTNVVGTAFRSRLSPRLSSLVRLFSQHATARVLVAAIA